MAYFRGEGRGVEVGISSRNNLHCALFDGGEGGIAIRAEICDGRGDTTRESIKTMVGELLVIQREEDVV